MWLAWLHLFLGTSLSLLPLVPDPLLEGEKKQKVIFLPWSSPEYIFNSSLCKHQLAGPLVPGQVLWQQTVMFQTLAYGQDGKTKPREETAFI